MNHNIFYHKYFLHLLKKISLTFSPKNSLLIYIIYFNFLNFENYNFNHINKFSKKLFYKVIKKFINKSFLNLFLHNANLKLKKVFYNS